MNGVNVGMHFNVSIVGYFLIVVDKGYKNIPGRESLIQRQSINLKK